MTRHSAVIRVGCDIGQAQLCRRQVPSRKLAPDQIMSRASSCEQWFSHDSQRAIAALSASHNSSSSLFARICSGGLVSEPTSDVSSSLGRDHTCSTQRVLSAFVNRYQHSVAPYRPASSRRSTNSRGNLASPSLAFPTKE